jgi:hypothetical protein
MITDRQYKEDLLVIVTSLITLIELIPQPGVKSALLDQLESINQRLVIIPDNDTNYYI